MVAVINVGRRNIFVIGHPCFPCAERYIPYDVAVFAATGAGNGTGVAMTSFVQQGSK